MALTENPQQLKAHADALRQLVERIERTMAHAQDVERWLVEDELLTDGWTWDVREHLWRARSAALVAEQRLR